MRNGELFQIPPVAPHTDLSSQFLASLQLVVRMMDTLNVGHHLGVYLEYLQELEQSDDENAL